MLAVAYTKQYITINELTQRSAECASCCFRYPKKFVFFVYIRSCYSPYEDCLIYLLVLSSSFVGIIWAFDGCQVLFLKLSHNVAVGGK